MKAGYAEQLAEQLLCAGIDAGLGSRSEILHDAASIFHVSDGELTEPTSWFAIGTALQMRQAGGPCDFVRQLRCTNSEDSTLFAWRLCDENRSAMEKGNHERLV